MNIIAKSSNVTNPMDMYNLTQAPDREKLSNAIGATLTLDKWVIYSEVNSKGEEMQLLSLTTTDGKAYTTNSATFTRDFMNAVAMFSDFGAEFHVVQVSAGTSKNGRSFISCKVVE